MWDGEFGGEQVPSEKGATPKQRYEKKNKYIEFLLN